MKKYIAGLNIGNHDSSAALLKNGELVSFIEQERISRNKMAFGEAPIEALQKCLDQEHISLEDVACIGVGMDWHYRNRIYQLTDDELRKYKMFERVEWFLPKSVFGEKIPHVYEIKHHLAHASSAYRMSGFSDAAVLVVDNRGEDSSTSLGFAQNGKIHFFKRINIHNSLGIFYNRACQYAGLYGKYREVGKLMGLASYGKANIHMPLTVSRDGCFFKELDDIENESIFEAVQMRSRQLLEYFKERCFPYEMGNNDEIMSYANFAASAQHSLEVVLLDLVDELYHVTKSTNLVIAGGVALNCSANGAIERSKKFKNIFIPPFASDAGVAIGAALECDYLFNGLSSRKTPLTNCSLGIEYNLDSILQCLSSYQNQISWVVRDEDLYDIVAEYLSNGSVVGWMQGRFEAGPRALGNRSILADPRIRKSLIRLNNIKKREMWRPIAPSVLKERYVDFFEGSPENKYFMNVATTVKKEKQHLIPAVVHVDGSSRPQVVDQTNLEYYNLIKAFENKTGIPILCNTSFNLQGVPLVNTPQDAVEAFIARDIDVLVMGKVIVKKV